MRIFEVSSGRGFGGHCKGANRAGSGNKTDKSPIKRCSHPLIYKKALFAFYNGGFATKKE